MHQNSVSGNVLGEMISMVANHTTLITLVQLPGVAYRANNLQIASIYVFKWVACVGMHCVHFIPSMLKKMFSQFIQTFVQFEDGIGILTEAQLANRITYSAI